ncbi:serine hydrolase [Solwaraspora sp. WMMA2056]|uniref:serine hydrolase n=1 Tax=Solwaraspora sp. WMMA2056 TaxID=3015161 RepID=UPI00259B481A|nr:serine hydrolase [Solwaraspora sp. WMMA2056]WJK40823.1 serine hydrolase [Solwaraspora sp. WMMA2056]
MERIRRGYARQRRRAGGQWCALVSRVTGDGGWEPVFADDADRVVPGYSVQKLAVAVAVLDKVDRGLLRLDDRLDLAAPDILGGSGIYHLHGVWGDTVTVANVLTAMLLVSDNTAVRLCGRVAAAREINEILAAKGLTHTRVEPVADPHRFLLGVTTPRETHDLLVGLAGRTLLSAGSCRFLLRVLRGAAGYHDGVRRTMSSAERARVATKHGADVDADVNAAARHEVGIIADADGAPALVYAFFADGLDDPDNYGATHPAVEAHAVLGRLLLDAVPTGRVGASG